MLREDKNKIGKRDLAIQIIEKKARKIIKKKDKLEKLHQVLEKTLQKAGLQNLNLVGIVE